MADYAFELAGFKEGQKKPVEEAITAVPGVMAAAVTRTARGTPTLFIDGAISGSAITVVNTAIAHLHIIAAAA